MRENNELRCFVRLAAALGPGSTAARRILESGRTASEICAADPMALRIEGIFTPQELHRLESTPQHAADEIIEKAAQLGQQILSVADADYPPLLREIASPPLVLYVMGDRTALGGELPIGMVGTRKASPYGIAAAEQLAMQLVSYGAVVVSGLAIGIDTCSHRGALKGNGRTVAVLGCGLDIDYPRSNAALRRMIEQNGALVSEYSPGTPPLAHHFPMRNRILAGLCRGVVVVESDIRSGSQITVGHALTEGRDVFAVPGSIFETGSRGPNRLLQQGSAKPVCCAQDILEEYLPAELLIQQPPEEKPVQKPPKPEPPAYLSAPQREIYAILDHDPIGIEELVQRSGMTMYQALTALTELEIFGLVRIYPGKRYSV